MKNYIFTAAILFLLVSCKDQQKEEALTHQRDSLINVIDERETVVNEYIAVFNEVERNLDSVSAKQHIIRLKSGKANDAKLHHKERIVSEIKAINTLMDQNAKKLKELYAKFKLSATKNDQLEKTIVLLNNQLNRKYTELAELNKELKGLNAQVNFLETVVDILAEENVYQAQTIYDKTNQMHTAYYIVAKTYDLEKWSLIDRQGGFLGVGQTSKLSNNLDMNMFTKIDYLEVTTIPINSKGIKIITTHPTGSFTVNKSGKLVNSITINDPEKFWSASKYLVVTM